MASHRRRRRSLRGFGNIISVRKGVDGLFDTGTVVGDALPVVLGGAVAVATTILVRKMVPAVVTAAAPAAGGAAGFGTLSSMMVQYAPLVGALAGSLAGLGLVYGMGKRTAGTAMMASAVTVGGVLQYGSSMGLSGFGAIVPEYGMGAVMPMMNGLGATVLEEWNPGQRPDSIGALSGAYGTTVDLSGLGAVNTGAFGTPGFHV